MFKSKTIISGIRFFFFLYCAMASSPLFASTIFELFFVTQNPIDFITSISSSSISKIFGASSVIVLF
jgi:hypothetical protein